MEQIRNIEVHLERGSFDGIKSTSGKLAGKQDVQRRAQKGPKYQINGKR